MAESLPWSPHWEFGISHRQLETKLYTSGAVVPVFAEEVEHCETVPIADDGLTVDQAGFHRQQGHRRDDLREAARKVSAVSGEQTHAAINVARENAEAVMPDLMN